MARKITVETEKAAGSKRAVVLIHGIGNQSPMQTLRGFVDAVWNSDHSLKRQHGPHESWTKPDTMSGSFELRRITTTRDKTGIRTDFFEFYYAHLLEGTSFSTVFWWIWRIFFRSTARVPRVLDVPWIAGILALLLLVGALLAMGFLLLKTLQALPWSLACAALWLAVAAALALLLWVLRHRVLVEVVGDAASYLTAAPQNIAARTEIRKSGLALLEELHVKPEYGRIIVACHSLGTVVGYDILNFFWNERSKDIQHATPEERRALAEMEAAAELLRKAPGSEALAAYRAQQRSYAKSIQAMTGGGWKISDFITLGSPLTHAHVLLTNDREPLSKSDTARREGSVIWAWMNWLDERTRAVSGVLASRIAERAFPSAPPEPEDGGFSYNGEGKARTPHHAAVFAPVRWTNIFAPRRCLLKGDLIGGPVAPLFGPGVKDVALAGTIGRSWFAHTRYWEMGAADDAHLQALREAVDLLDTA